MGRIIAMAGVENDHEQIGFGQGRVFAHMRVGHWTCREMLESPIHI